MALQEAEEEEEAAIIALQEAQEAEEDVALAETLLAAESERRARGGSGSSSSAKDTRGFGGDGVAGELGDGKVTWDGESKKALSEAYRSVRPAVTDFWAHVAQRVPGKTAQECHDEHTRAFPTPAALTRKADDRRRRPTTPKESAAGAGRSGGGSAELEEDAINFSAGKGTGAWRKQVRHMVAHDAQNHADDVFDSTPFKSTPFKNLTSEAAKLVPSSATSGGLIGRAKASAAVTASTTKLKPSSSFSRSNRPELVADSPGILRTPGLDGRDCMDAYIDRIRARTRQAAGAERHASKNEGPAAACKVSGKAVREGSHRLVAVVKAIAKSGQNAVDNADLDDEDLDEDEFQNEIEL